MSIKLHEKILIGFTGSFGSGCTTASTFLDNYINSKSKEENNYCSKRSSLSTYVKEEAEKRNTILNRRNLQNIGNELRKSNNDRGFLAKELINEIENCDIDVDIIIIDGIRNAGEVEVFRQFGKFYLINIDAELDVRWKRYDKLPSKEYTLKEDFINDDEKDSGKNEDKFGQQVRDCVYLSDIVINNNHNYNLNNKENKFFNQIIFYFDLILNPGSKLPKEIEVYMTNAYNLSLKSKCIKRQVGAIITKEEHILASGYNDTPTGLDSCIELYNECYRDMMSKCTKCKRKIQDKKKSKCMECDENIEYQIKLLTKNLDLCRAIHAEERAILQVGKFGGISLMGSALYTTTFPCKLCAKKIIETGISIIIYTEPYPNSDSWKFLTKLQKNGRIQLIKFEGVKAQALYKLYRK